jgi:hypothetical protein
MLTNQNELLTKEGIHGKIAAVGIGFGTGRHTAKLHSVHKAVSRLSEHTDVEEKALGELSKKESLKHRSLSPPARTISRLCYDHQNSVRSKCDQVSVGRFDAF